MANKTEFRLEVPTDVHGLMKDVAVQAGMSTYQVYVMLMIWLISKQSKEDLIVIVKNMRDYLFKTKPDLFALFFPAK